MLDHGAIADQAAVDESPQETVVRRRVWKIPRHYRCFPAPGGLVITDNSYGWTPGLFCLRERRVGHDHAYGVQRKKCATGAALGEGGRGEGEYFASLDCRASCYFAW